MTGALLIIKPGGMRELHWHPQCRRVAVSICKGSARMTVFGSHGRARTDEFAAGDVGYVPQGYGHYIENTGSDELEVVLVFNNGTYESISITAWMAGNPDLLLSTNFGVPESVFAQFPKDALIMPSLRWRERFVGELARQILGAHAELRRSTLTRPKPREIPGGLRLGLGTQRSERRRGKRIGGVGRIDRPLLPDEAREDRAGGASAQHVGDDGLAAGLGECRLV